MLKMMFCCRARAINSLGVKGTFNQITTNIAGQGVPPDDVTNFDAIVSGDNVDIRMGCHS